MSFIDQLAGAQAFVSAAWLAKRIAQSSLPWKDKYSLIFSAEVSRVIFDSGIPFDWVDPDGSYEDDVRAFVDAVNLKAQELGAE
jgi:hypothetical protein